MLEFGMYTCLHNRSKHNLLFMFDIIEAHIEVGLLMR